MSLCMICVFHTITFAIKEEYEFIQDKIQKYNYNS